MRGVTGLREENAPLEINAGRSAWWQLIEEYIRSQIASRRLRRGDAVPSVRKIARAFNVSTNTAERAYGSLIRTGVLVTRQGRGTFVSPVLDIEVSGSDMLLEAAATEFANVAQLVGAPLDEATRELTSAFHRMRHESDAASEMMKS